MIEAFASIDPDADAPSALASAQRSAGRDRRATLAALAGVLVQARATRDVWEAAVRSAIEHTTRDADYESAALLHLALGRRGGFDALLDRVQPLTRAELLTLRSEGAPEQLVVAGDAYLEAGAPTRAAITFERADAPDRARDAWARVVSAVENSPRRDDYTLGLAHFDVSRMARQLGRGDEARTAMQRAVGEIEAAADRLERSQRRDRAFDCYQALVAIGLDAGVAEHVLEGGVNSVRVLRADNLRGQAAIELERVVAALEGLDEFVAAASLARDLAQLARELHRAPLRQRAARRTVALWRAAAQASFERGAPGTTIERELTAALAAAAEDDLWATARSLYEELAALPSAESSRERWLRGAARLAGLGDAASPAEGGGRVSPPPTVWHDDVVEWELDGDAGAACAQLLLDPGLRQDVGTRRAALGAALVARSVARLEGDARIRGELVLARRLATVGLWSLLSPLERLARSPSHLVRREAVRAVARYPYKRSFELLERALTDSDEATAEAAARAIEGMHAEHALEPLLRIELGAARSSARRAALRALCRLEAPEAAERVLAALLRGTTAEREELLVLLATTRSSALDALARAELARDDPHARDVLTRLLEMNRF